MLHIRMRAGQSIVYFHRADSMRDHRHQPMEFSWLVSTSWKHDIICSPLTCASNDSYVVIQEIMTPTTSDTPLGTPSQRLLDRSDQNAQYTPYHPEAKNQPWNVPESTLLSLRVLLSLSCVMFSDRGTG